ncbi:TraX family protein [Marinilactibacillus sp. XAAS-LB27]|uniref:TraX family protein n=1 Tax=unclassified Marinilactibacillus TaxID=2632303 RepID=UPI001CE4B3CE|nr:MULTISPECIES: TraX family protein [unclassified Marinilactibacillus]MEC6748877.1 TraX family protein [Marinilactibacillus sp. XAAS-LB27]
MEHNLEKLDRVKIGLNANVLKLVAVTAMFFDHSLQVFDPGDTPLRWIVHFFGRLAAPLICYLIAEGYHYTSDKRSYTKRLFLFALISHIPYVILFNLNWWMATSVMWSLTLGLVALTAAKHKQMHVLVKVGVVLLCCLAAYPANWHYIAVLWIVSFGVFREQFNKKMLAYTLIGLMFYAVPGLFSMGTFVTYRFGFLMAILFFYLYNGKPGKRNPFYKWAFYWFYPVHLVLFILLSMLFI